MKINRLYIDETGVIDGNSGHYIIVGCVIREDKRKELEKIAGQIKYKYWDDDSIVFHSQEIGKKLGAFKIFSDSDIEEKFNKDLFKLLRASPVILFPVILDKRAISARHWGRKRKLRTINRSLIRNFILFTLSTGDIEEQLADIFAYGIECKLKNCKYDKDSYEGKLITILDTKLFKMPKNVKGRKKKILSEIDPFVLIN
jgi:hypothetical protein